MSFLRGDCALACSKDDGDACWHKNTVVRKQLLSGKWMLENKRGHIRLADEDMVVFEDGEYIKHKNPHISRYGDAITPAAILKSIRDSNNVR